MFCLKLMPFIGVIWKYAAVYLDFGSLSVFFFGIILGCFHHVSVIKNGFNCTFGSSILQDLRFWSPYFKIKHSCPLF
jgi:hypothetical protein